MRLYIYGGNKYENRRIIGEWNKLPPQEIFLDRKGIYLDEWSYGIGIIDNNPTLILRTIQTDSSDREYPFVILIDVGTEIWKRFGWNAAQLAKILLESKHFEKLRLSAESVVLTDMENIFLDTASNDSLKKAHELKLLTESIAGSIEFENAPCIGLDKTVNVDDLAYNIEQMPACFRCGNGWIVGGTMEQAQSFGAHLLFNQNNTESENIKILLQKGRDLLEFCDNNKKSLGEILDIPKFLWSNAENSKFKKTRDSLKEKARSQTAAYSGKNKLVATGYIRSVSPRNIPQHSETLGNDSKYADKKLFLKDKPEQVSDKQLNRAESVESNIQINPVAAETNESIDSLKELNEYLDEVKKGRSSRKLLITSIYLGLIAKDKRLELLEKFFSNPQDLFWREVFENLPFGLQDEIVRIAHEYIPETFNNTVSYLYKDAVTKENKETFVDKSLALAVPYFLLRDTSKEIFQDLIKINGESFSRNVESWKKFADGLAEEEKFDWMIDDKSYKENKEITGRQDLLATSMEEHESPGFFMKRLFFLTIFILVVGCVGLYFAINRFPSLIGIHNTQFGTPIVTPLPIEFADPETQELYNKLSQDKKAVIEPLPVGKNISTDVFQKLISRLAEIINRTHWKLLIEVHTDLSGKPEDNLKTATDRGKQIRDNLVRLGVKVDQVEIRPVGDKEPTIPIPNNQSDAERNRRLVIKLNQF